MLVGPVKTSRVLHGYPRWEATFFLTWRDRDDSGIVRNRRETVFRVPWRRGEKLPVRRYHKMLESLVRAKYAEFGIALDPPVSDCRELLIDALAEYLATLPARLCAPSVKRYAKWLGDFAQHCQAFDLDYTDKLQQTHIAQWRELRAGFYTWPSLRPIVSALQGFLDWLLARGLNKRPLIVLPVSARKRLARSA